DTSIFNLTVKDLDLLYNGAASDNSKLDWDNLTTDGTVTGLAGLTSTLDLKVGGSVELGIASFVKAAGEFSISKETGVSIDDGTMAAFTGDVLNIDLSNVQLFAGVGAGDFIYDANGELTDIDTTNATGFKVSGAGLNLSIIDNNASSQRWTGLAAH